MKSKGYSEEQAQCKSSKSIPLHKSNRSEKSLKGSNAGSLHQQKSRTLSSYDRIKNKNPIKPYIYHLFKLLSFIINFNYSVENTLITMIMISFLTPNIVDSLIWTIPNFISIIIRPYLIRHVHKVHKTHRVRSEALIMNFFLFLGAVGGFIIAQSTLMNNSKKGFHALRILVCSIGWTLTGTSFELCEYFIDKFKASLQQQFYIKKPIQLSDKKNDTNSISNEEKKGFVLINFEEEEEKLNRFSFLGSLSGYLVVFLLFTFSFKNMQKMRSFFETGNIAYMITGFLTLFGAIICFVLISYVGIPKADPSVKSKSKPFKISKSLNYYLPGWSQLKSMSVRGLSYLGVHFVVNFVMDVMFIYTTMWIAVSESTSEMKESQCNFFGIQYGVGYLMMFTVIHYAKIPLMEKWRMTVFNLVILASTIQFVLSFWFNTLLVYHNLIVLLAVFLSIYENQIEPVLQETQPQIKQAKELIVRMEKVAVLNVLPFVTMILLERDDIEDCLVWCAVLLIVSVSILWYFNPNNNKKVSPQQLTQKEKIL